MNKSDNIQDLAAALAKAQGEIENAAKSSENLHFKNKYADLAEILNTVRPVFSAHGLAVVQMPSFCNDMVSVETLLTHSTGQWISNIASAPIGAKKDAQGVGSAITYLRRYSLSAFAGIAQEDDDGNHASVPAKKPKIELSRFANAVEAVRTGKVQVERITAEFALTDEQMAALIAAKTQTMQGETA